MNLIHAYDLSLRDDQCECEATDGYWTSGCKGILAHIDDAGNCDSFIQAHGECEIFESDALAARYLRTYLIKKGKATKAMKIYQRTVQDTIFYYLHTPGDPQSDAIRTKLLKCNPHG